MQKKILLWFDVEDYLTVESDDALLELLKMLEESGVRATPEILYPEDGASPPPGPDGYY